MVMRRSSPSITRTMPASLSSTASNCATSSVRTGDATKNSSRTRSLRLCSSRRLTFATGPFLSKCVTLSNNNNNNDNDNDDDDDEDDDDITIIIIIIIIINNNNYDNLYGAVTWPCHYKGASQATK